VRHAKHSQARGHAPLGKFFETECSKAEFGKFSVTK